ncbi:hypothetical protein ACTHQC_07310 [Bacillus paralicheniformis]|uniref:hypothetical protein n=1 Tax=Bacillus paralicheniformis TaxID=1648923 RepID=UPI003F7C7C5F
MRDYQKLEAPQLIELDGEYGFIIAPKIDISEMRNGIIFMTGQSYNYEDGEVKKGRIIEVECRTMFDARRELDGNGNIID